MANLGGGWYIRQGFLKKCLKPNLLSDVTTIGNASAIELKVSALQTLIRTRAPTASIIAVLRADQTFSFCKENEN